MLSPMNPATTTDLQEKCFRARRWEISCVVGCVQVHKCPDPDASMNLMRCTAMRVLKYGGSKEAAHS